MKRLLLLAIIATFSVMTQAQIVITEISYNPPESGSDSLEFIEFYNIGNSAVNMTNYTLPQGVVYTFGNVSIPAGGYVVICIDSLAMQNVYGVAAYEWSSGSLSNSGEDIVLHDNTGTTLDSVDYDDGSPWPTGPDGNGPSLVLCDSSLDNNNGANWLESASSTGIIINGSLVYGSPGAADSACLLPPPPPPSFPEYSISLVNTETVTGVADSLGVTCFLTGVVVGVDMRGGTGIQFTIMEQNGSNIDGINVFSFNDINGYVVDEGDSIMVRGSVAQFNGMTQFDPDSISLLNQNNPIPDTVVVTTLDESAESELVRFENALITAVSGSNYTLVSGLDTIVMRVDSDTDVDDSLSLNVGDSLCWVVGIGGQFDSSNPFTDGYQLFPRYYTDIDTSCGTPTPPPTIPFYSISQINGEDANGVADSLGVVCWTKGVVVGIDLDGNNGLSFTIMDQVGAQVDGINIFNFNDVSNYVVTEGDSIMVRGDIGQFNGLTQLSPDSIELLNQNNTLPTIAVVTTLDESTESELIRVEDLLITGVNGSNWTMVSGNDTIVMRVDSDTDVDDSLSFVIGDSLCWVIGIGGQFDSSNPFTSGYQIFPHYYTDVDTSCGGTIVVPPSPALPIYPIGTIQTIDGAGELDSAGVNCGIRGIVAGVDLQGTSTNNSFTVIDNTGGFGVFKGGGFTPAYMVTEGDSVIVYGSVGDFNGLAQLSADSMVFINAGNMLPPNMAVTVLDESTESELIRLEQVQIVDTSDWSPGGSGFNIEVVNCASDTFQIRIDSDTDVDDVFPSAPSAGLININGIGGQFDNSAPHLDGYQFYVHRASDIDTNSGAAPMTPTIVINELMADNLSTVQDANGDFDDWVELFNTGAMDAPLGGLWFSNDAAMLDMYQVPMASTSSLTAGGYSLVWCDNEDSEGDLHTTFELDAAGGFFAVSLAYVTNCTTTNIIVIDSVTYGPLSADESFGRSTDGASDFIKFGVATPEAANEILAVEENGGASDLKAWPNPTVNTLYFSRNVNYNMYNLTGKVVASGTNTRFADVSALSDGLYIVKTSEGEMLRIVVE